jgi:hypothetical protein
MSDEHDSWFKDAFGVDLGEAAEKIKGQASAAVDQATADVTGPVDDAAGLGSNVVQAPSRSSPDSDASIDEDSDEYQQGYQDGVNGNASNAGPRAGAGLANYAAGYAAGEKKRSAPSPHGGADSDDAKQGYEDGLSGKEPNQGPRFGDALEEYEDGYAKGKYEWTQKQEEEDQEKRRKEIDESNEEVGKVLEHVLIHGVVHKVTHILKLGGGLFVLIVSMVAGMKCDTKLYRFKCGTCGEQQDECTEEDAQADADKHMAENPDHVVDISGPGTK